MPFPMHLPRVLMQALLRGVATFVIAVLLLLFAGWANSDSSGAGSLLSISCGSSLIVFALTLVEWLVTKQQLARRRLPLAVIGVWLLALSGSTAFALNISLISELNHGLSFEQSLHNVLFFAKMSPSKSLILPVVCAGALSVAFSARVLSASAEHMPLRQLLWGQGARAVLPPLLAGFLFSVVVAVIDYLNHVVIASVLAAIAYWVVLAPMIVFGGGVLLLGYGLVDRLLPAAEPVRDQLTQPGQ